MDRYIGLDVHASSCTMAVVGPSGRQLKSAVIETNGRALVEAMKLLPRPRHLCFEEGTQSAWLYEVLSPHVDELVVAGINQSLGAKSDARDALALAQSLRLGAVETPVFKAPRRFALLRSLARTYDLSEPVEERGALRPSTASDDIVNARHQHRTVARRGAACAIGEQDSRVSIYGFPVPSQDETHD